MLFCSRVTFLSRLRRALLQSGYISVTLAPRSSAVGLHFCHACAALFCSQVTFLSQVFRHEFIVGVGQVPACAVCVTPVPFVSHLCRLCHAGGGFA
eukprot:5369344-Pyramimonas_sp.AAC.1